MLCVTPSEHADRLYSKQCRHVIAEAERHDFGSLVLTSSMFINHMPDRCVGVLNSCCTQACSAVDSGA